METSEHSLAARDTVAIIAILAMLEGALAVGTVPQSLERILLHELERNALVLPGAEREELAAALHALGSRVRWTLG
ncbi:hypothetical protein [Rathayibacter agropyri]|uniref:hypothetical protein n=1 Tax=Rathayibacter agropyri TaxID=1634927 RepID=UPI0015652C40|nr:hypothetical protein [Rathayibacter agropyri]NRD07464.1 hypothetical protein [Rathayibacter agropyri]